MRTFYTLSFHFKHGLVNNECTEPIKKIIWGHLISLQGLLQKISNVDFLLTISTIVVNDPQKCSNRQLNYLLTLNSLLDLIEPLNEVISKLEEPFFLQLRKTLENQAFEHIKKLIRQTIQDGAHPAAGQFGIFQRCFAIKPGINGLLDLVRTTYSERINDMKGIIALFRYITLKIAPII